MLRRRLALAVLLGCWVGGSAVQAAEPAMACEIGPVTKTYGATAWLVYSCSDGRSVVFVSAPGSPASPFYFILSPVDGKYRLRGEGTGNKTATDAAYAELQRLNEATVRALIQETRSVRH